MRSVQVIVFFSFICWTLKLCHLNQCILNVDNRDLILPFQIIEFDLKGSPLDSSSFIDVVVKDYETIGKDKYVCIHH